MADKSLDDILKSLENGLKELFDSEKYKQYLNTMSKFHNYSFNNSLLIAMQNPEATLVAGYNSWKKQFGRVVNKGEKGIKILAPAPFKKKVEKEMIDPVSGKPLILSNGETQKEMVEITIPSFKPVTVFDISQTSGKDIELMEVNELLGTVEGYETFKEALFKISPVPIETEAIEGGAKGYFSPTEQRIALLEGMSEIQSIKTMIHEIAHALLHDKDGPVIEGIDEKASSRASKETEAESVAYTVCSHFGIDTSDYSFKYLAGWSAGKELEELKNAMDTIRITSSTIISGIEEHFETAREEKLNVLARDLDEFAKEYDPYSYADDVINTDDPVSEIIQSLRDGETEGLIKYLEIASEESAIPEIASKADELIARVNEYKPKETEIVMPKQVAKESKEEAKKEPETIKQRMVRLKEKVDKQSSNNRDIPIKEKEH